jgi:predicted MFS family arabinose efflux permease
MQEKIRTARHNDNLFIAVAVVGILITVLVPYITHFVRYNNMDTVSWSLTAIGVVLFIGSALGILNNNNNIKELIRQLEKGQEETEGDEDKEEEKE